MELNENIITIRKRDIREGKKAFAHFMSLSEDCFNNRSKINPSKYKHMSPTELEEATRSILEEVKPGTAFEKEEIKLVSGHSFPDIMAGKYYGVEVKSTKEDKWTSVGSSIVESTRNPFVEDIYMLFGKLGGVRPEFRFRPYEDCLSNIAVTHSPRYLIDMELRDKCEKTIFDKLEVPYYIFNKSEDKIEIVRDFYIKQARLEKKEEMPWWVGKKTIATAEDVDIPSIRLLNNCESEEIKRLKAQMAILFPKVIIGDYAEAALWLCTHRYLLSLNLRDLFSAGGQWKILNGHVLKFPYPAVLGKLMEIMSYIRFYLNNDSDLEYQEFNSDLYYSKDRYNKWLDQAVSYFQQCKYQVGNNKCFEFASLKIDVRDYLTNPDRYQLKHKL